MGYTHYWYRTRDIPGEAFSKIVKDFTAIQPLLHGLGVKLAGGDGEGEPMITDALICFNGLAHCGHVKKNLGIAWPSDTARHVYNGCGHVIDGSWFAGITISERTCGGDCSHESFYFPKSLSGEKEPTGRVAYLDQNGHEILNEPDRVGKFFDFTKTAFKPYDLAVNIALVIAKHYLGDDLIVSSDGKMQQWIDAVMICQKFFGYGEDFKI